MIIINKARLTKKVVIAGFNRYLLQLTSHWACTFLLGMLVILSVPLAVTGADDRPLSDLVLSEATLVYEGIAYALIEGDIYSVDINNNLLLFIVNLHEKDYYENNYIVIDQTVNRWVTPLAIFIPVKRHLQDNFENANTIHNLIGFDRGWTDVIVQSPAAPRKNDYINLRNSIFFGLSDFIDNRVEPSPAVVYTGSRALYTHAVAKTSEMVVSKAFLGSQSLHYLKGDDVWFSAMYYIDPEEGTPQTIMDLETSWYRERPGLRLMITDVGHLQVELKWIIRLKYRQLGGQEVQFPKGQWVHIETHYYLSDEDDGVIEIWQDGVKIIDEQGQTLPIASTIYNYLEIGITAHNSDSEDVTVYVDDMVISDQPIN